MEEAPLAQRLPAIDLLSHTNLTTAGPTLFALLAPSRPAMVQMAAVRALTRLPEPAAAAGLVEPARWQVYTPRVRDAVLTAMLSEPRLVSVLLDAIARKDVNPSAIGAARARRLIAHPDADIRDRARTLLAGLDATDGLPAYQRVRTEVLARTGVAARGRRQFTAYCAACHTFGGAGGRVGPDLTGLRNQPADAVLLHIVVPDYEITPGYESYTVHLQRRPHPRRARGVRDRHEPDDQGWRRRGPYRASCQCRDAGRVARFVDADLVPRGHVGAGSGRSDFLHQDPLEAAAARTHRVRGSSVSTHSPIRGRG